MKLLPTNYAALLFLLGISFSQAQTIWTGPPITFTKADDADFDLEVNQDRLTDNVWITRKNTRGLYNYIDAPELIRMPCPSAEPRDTEWAYGTTEDYANLTYSSFGELIGCDNLKSLENGSDNMVVHLITDDIYIDIRINSWSLLQKGGKGGFSYTRSTDATLSLDEFSRSTALQIHPNPVSDVLYIKNDIKDLKYQIFNITGAPVMNDIQLNNDPINVSKLAKGIYFLQFEKAKSIKFVKL